MACRNDFFAMWRRPAVGYVDVGQQLVRRRRAGGVGLGSGLADQLDAIDGEVSELIDEAVAEAAAAPPPAPEDLTSDVYISY